MKRRTLFTAAFSLVELLAIVAILAAVAALVLPRATAGADAADEAACLTIRGDLEVQVELWRQNTGAWPATTLSDIGADRSYFPTGVPLCPVDGSAYSINAAGRVVGHNH